MKLGFLWLLAALPACACDRPALPAADPQTPLRTRLAGASVAAHRGGSWALTANTLANFEEARQAGVDIIEMDLRPSKDGIPIVYHDDNVFKLFGHDPAIKDLTLEELKQYRVAWSQPIPTFEEVLEWSAGRVVINAEFKTPDVVLPAVDLVKKYDAYEWVYFQTKDDPERYHLARQHDPQVALLYKPMSMKDLDWALSLKDDRLVVIEIDPTMLRREVIQKVHQAGKLNSYNVWRLARLQEFFKANCPEAWKLGIDIAVSKRPASAARQRDTWEESHAIRP